MKPTTIRYTVVAKVFCPRCGAFAGLETSDGRGPWAPDCDDPACPMLYLERNEPRPLLAYRCGSLGAQLDEDAGGYRSIAVRALEDGLPDES